ncbi:MAG TPA: hypothetical protein VL262_00410 [Vicinamibacterales bacterium]|nr:hypothetical protein [Vicinamibacterales bacterium]
MPDAPDWAAHMRPACLPQDAVERGERAAKLEIGEPIQHGESGPCDPDVGQYPDGAFHLAGVADVHPYSP